MGPIALLLPFQIRLKRPYGHQSRPTDTKAVRIWCPGLADGTQTARLRYIGKQGGSLTVKLVKTRFADAIQINLVTLDNSLGVERGVVACSSH